MSRGVNQTGLAILKDNNGNPLAIMRSDGSIKFMVPVELSGANSGAVGAGSLTKTDEITLTPANIIDTAALGFGHAAGFPLVAAPGAGFGVELVNALMIYTRDTATYGAGGNITINVSGGGAALTGLVSAANSLGNAASKNAIFRPLAAAAEVLGANTGLNLVSSAAFTNPGTAAGTVKVRVTYKIHVIG